MALYSKLGPKTADEYRIAHLSDLHISTDRSGIRHRFRSWVRQSHAKNLQNFQAVMRDLESHEIDHLIVTGDLTGGARDEELTAFKAVLGPYADPKRLTIIPGNHDISFRHSNRRIRRVPYPRKLSQLGFHFPDLVPPKYPGELGLRKKHPYPFVRVLGGGSIALIGLDTTNRLTPKAGPLNSLGSVSNLQLGELRAILKSPWIHDRLKIVAMHHHPMIVPVSTMFDNFKHLFQSRQLLDLLYENQVDLILHGHKHHPFCWQSHTFRDHDVTVICAGPPDAYAHGKQTRLVYNIYSFVGHRIAVHYHSCSPTLRRKTEFDHSSRHAPREDDTQWGADDAKVTESGSSGSERDE